MDEELIELEEELDEVVIDIEESIGFVSGKAGMHVDLPDRNNPNQHEIKAITRLGDELKTIKELKTVYSNKVGVANYYKWSDGKSHDEYGYFVTLDSANTIKLCNGNNNDAIFGVTVNEAGFVGGQSEIIDPDTDGASIHTYTKDNTYALVVTSGCVRIRCGKDVIVGDYVISNIDGTARKTETEHGYKVVAIDEKLSNDDVRYVFITLGVQSDVTDKMSARMEALSNNINAVESQVITATNLAQDAINLIEDIDTSKLVTSDKIEGIENTANDAILKAEGAQTSALNASALAVQAKAIAESAAVSAETIKDEAVKDANEALQSTIALRNDFDDMGNTIVNIDGELTAVRKTVAQKYVVVDSWENADKDKHYLVYYVEKDKKYRYYDNNEWKETADAATAGLPVAISGIQAKTDENSSSINGLTSFQGETKNTMTRLEQKSDANGAYIHSTVASINKYAVGPHSQSYGFTLEQAADILEEGMMYVPTEDMTIEYGNAEIYSYMDGEEKKTYAQEFDKGFLYRWTNGADHYMWIAVDKNYTEVDRNTSNMSVYFQNQAPTTIDIAHGYWYKTGVATKGDKVIETEYEVGTLYKWSSYTTKDADNKVIEKQQWVPVATLAENSQNRAVSQIRQDANSIESRVTNAEGSVASSKQWIDNNSANIQDVVSWKSENGESLVTFMQTADENYASASQVAKIVDKDGNVKEASIVAAVNNNASSINLDANYVTVEGFTTFQGEVKKDINDTVVNSRIEYARASSATVFDDTTKKTDWNIVAPDWVLGEYVWQRTVVVKKDNSETPSNPVCIQGAKGADGTGVAIKGVAYITYKNGTTSVDETYLNELYSLYSDESKTKQITDPQDGDAYLVDGYLFVYSGDGNNFTCVGKIQGTQGVGVSNVVNYYMASSRSAGVVAGTAGETSSEKWTQSVQTTSNAKRYLWNYEVTVYTNGASESTTPVIIGNYSSDGKGIQSIDEIYCISDLETCDAPDEPTFDLAGGFEDGIYPYTWYNVSPPTDLKNKYLWNCERVVYTDRSADVLAPALIGTHGDKGDSAPEVKEVIKQYYLSTSNDELVGGEWSDKPSSLQKNRYMWTRDKYIMSDESVIYSDPVLDTGFTTMSQWCMENNTTFIDGASIYTGSIEAEKLATNAIRSHDYPHKDDEDNAIAPSGLFSDAGTFLNLADGAFYSKNFAIDENGNAYFNGSIDASQITTGTIDADRIEVNDLVAFGAKIGGWSIVDDGLTCESAGIFNSQIMRAQSSINPSTVSSIRFFSGKTEEDFEHEINNVDTMNCDQIYDNGVEVYRYIFQTTLGVNAVEQSFNIKTCTVTDASNFPIEHKRAAWAPSLKNAGDILILIDLYDRPTDNFNVLITGEYIKSNFMVLDDGSTRMESITASNGNIKSIQSNVANITSGTIGNFSFGGSTIHRDYNTYNGPKYGIDITPIGTHWPCLSIGECDENGSLGNNAAFRVDHDGTLHTKDIYVDGALSINAIYGAEGNDVITTANVKIYSSDILESESKFYRDIYIGLDKDLPYDLVIDLQWTTSNADDPIWNHEYVSILHGTTESHTVKLCIGTNSNNNLFIKLNGTDKNYIVVFDPSKSGSIDYGTITQKIPGSNLTVHSNIIPDGQFSYNLGNADNHWNNIYCGTSAIDLSDRNEKNTIEPISDAYDKVFDSLKPVSYKFNKNDSDRTHTGLVAQDVKEAVEGAGLTTQDFAAYCEWEKENGDVGCGLRYEEFISLCIDQIQKLKKRVEELEDKLNNTK